MVKNRAPELTSTSYAVLGLIALRPYSAYELSQQMKRSAHFIWPRAERAIYDEPKKLLANGLVTAAAETANRRRRTVYTITAEGRRALGEWLGRPCSPPMFESEALLRTAFAEQGSREDLLAAVRALREQADTLRAQASVVAQSYVEGVNPFPERIHVNALVGQFIFEYVSLLERWSAWAEAEVEGWPDTVSPSAFPGAREVFAQFLRQRGAPSEPPRQTGGSAHGE